MPIFLIPAAAGAYIYFEKMRAKKAEEEQQAEDANNDQALGTSEDATTIAAATSSSPDSTTDDPKITPSLFGSLEAAWKRGIDLPWSPVIQQKDLLRFKIDQLQYKMPKITFK
jgi:hypothetical protein